MEVIAGDFISSNKASAAFWLGSVFLEVTCIGFAECHRHFALEAFEKKKKMMDERCLRNLITPPPQ